MNVTVTREFAADPAAVWELLVETEHWPQWGPSVRDVELHGGRLTAGAEGRVRTAVGLWLPFRVSAFVEGRSWSWWVAGVPATTHQVEPVPGGCRVAFGVPLVVAPYAAVCHEALRRIERAALPSGPRTEERADAHDR
jgi:hypothetical protein